MDERLLRAFVTVAREGSFSGYPQLSVVAC